MKLYAVRHGETAWNAENRICGITDLSLTARGLSQAEELAAALSTVPLDRIIASPLLRAQQTAQVISLQHRIPVETDARLREQNYGIFEGMDRKTPAFLENKRHFAVRYPGGESMMDVAARVYPLLNELKTDNTCKSVLLVCHGGVLRVLRTYFLNMTNEEYFRYSPHNCAAEEYEL